MEKIKTYKENMPKKTTKYINNIAELNLPRPDQIKEYLDQYVIGQDEAKKTLSVAIYNHYKRILHNSGEITGNKDVIIEKSNITLVGPSGSGKTFMLKKIGELLKVPVYQCDTTKLTQSGYVGSDVEECLVGLLRVCDYDIEVAKCGIVILDECDKIRKADAGASITRDVGGEGVQQSLLKIVEGDIVGCPPAGGRKHPEQPLTYVDTTNILFVAIGAFVGLDDIVKRRMGSNKIGFNSIQAKVDNSISPLQYVTPQDLKEFGFIPEFIGRFPVITNVEKLTKDDLIKILVEPKNSLLKQYKELLAMDGIELEFKDDALLEVANISYTLETGARGLRSIMEAVLKNVMFNAPKMHDDGKTKITITKSDVICSTKNKFIEKIAA